MSPQRPRQVSGVVRIEVLSHTEPTLFDRLGHLAGKAKYLPPDAAEQHDHYLYSTPGELLMQDDIVALFAYDRWANRKMLDACRKLTAEQFVAEPVPGWSSVRSTIYHIAMAIEFNLRTLVGDPVDGLPTQADMATVDDVAQLLERAYRR